MDNLQALVNTLLTLALSVCGVYFFCRGGIRLLPRLLPRPTRRNRKQKHRSPHRPSPFGALCVALGGTIGVGNTIGVASAIALGGGGAIFWMWVSATFGMALKYAEVYLSHRFRDEKRRGGGAMILLTMLGKPHLAKLFSFCCVLVSFGMGNLAQSGAAARSLEEAFRLPRTVSGALIALLCLLVFVGGFRRLVSFSKTIVPAASLLFFLLCILTLGENSAHLPDAFLGIFRDAFSFQAVGGGLFGSALCRGISAGFSRGVFSNEAGLGSAPLVHSAADSDPQEQALWGAREVFLDTHVVCTLTALCILSSPVYLAGERDPGALCTAVFSGAFGGNGGAVFALSLFLFAAASILAWSYYGRCAVEFLSREKRSLFWYDGLFFAAVFLGSFFELNGLFLLSDVFNVLMALPNLYALLRLRNEVCFSVTKPSQCLHFVHKSNLSYGTICCDEGE